MAFQRDECVGLATPVLERFGEHRQQNFISARRQCRRGFAQQTAGQPGVQQQFALFEVLLRGAAFRVVHRPERLGGADLLPPLAHFGLALRRLCRIDQMPRPALEAAGFRPQISRTARSNLGVSPRQILQKHPPRHAIHHQVMGDQQQFLPFRHLRPHHAQQRAVLQIKAALGLFAQRSHGAVVGHVTQPEAVGSRCCAILLLPATVGVLMETQVKGIVMTQQRGQRLAQ